MPPFMLHPYTWSNDASERADFHTRCRMAFEGVCAGLGRPGVFRERVHSPHRQLRRVSKGPILTLSGHTPPQKHTHTTTTTTYQHQHHQHHRRRCHHCHRQQCFLMLTSTAGWSGIARSPHRDRRRPSSTLLARSVSSTARTCCPSRSPDAGNRAYRWIVSTRSACQPTKACQTA